MRLLMHELGGYGKNWASSLACSADRRCNQPAGSGADSV